MGKGLGVTYAIIIIQFNILITPTMFYQKERERLREKERVSQGKSESGECPPANVKKKVELLDRDRA